MLCWYASNVFLMCGTGMNRTLLSCDVMFSCDVLVCIKCVFHVLLNVVTLHTLKTHTNARAHTLTGGFDSYVGVYTAYVSGRHFLVPGLCQPHFIITISGFGVVVFKVAVGTTVAVPGYRQRNFASRMEWAYMCA